MNIKILLVEVFNRNYGDGVIADTTRFLLENLNVKGKCIEIFDYDIASRDVGQIKYMDAIIFCGGGIIKYLYEDFDIHIIKILNEADKLGVPVYLNTVGVEGYSLSNNRCQNLKKVLNYSCVKMISVRDDFYLLKKNYIVNDNIELYNTYDVAICCPEVYKTELRKKRSKKVVGLGIARKDLFIDNGIPKISGEYLKNFWIKFIKIIEKNGMNWKIFTNGLADDEKFAMEILESIGHGEKCKAPYSGQELYDNICSFDAIVATRLHSNIIAFANNIPSIGLVWNNKLLFFGQKTGYKDRYIQAEQINSEYVFEKLSNAIIEGSNRNLKTEKETIKCLLRRFIEKYCEKREKKEKEFVEIQDKLVASALGSISNRFRNTNTLEAVKYSVDMGFKNFEVDISKTRDGKYVCINGWTRNSYKKLNYSAGFDIISYNDFCKLKYYGKYDSLEFVKLLKWLQENVNNTITVIIDACNKNNNLNCDDIATIVNYLKKYNSKIKYIVRSSGNMLLRSQIQHYSSENIDFAYEIMENDDIMSIIQLCELNGIRYISMSDAVYEQNIYKFIEGNRTKVKIMVFSFMETEKIINAVNKGVEYVGSYSYSVKYINRMLNT